MVEKALDQEISAENVAHFHRSLLHSGLPITQMNTLRKHFSRVKGGRLAVAATGATQCTLLISDVPKDALHIIGSGPSVPDPSTLEECRRIIEDTSASIDLPRDVSEFSGAMQRKSSKGGPSCVRESELDPSTLE